MKQCEKLPENYQESKQINLENKKLSRGLTLCSAAIGIIIYVQALFTRGYLLLDMPKWMVIPIFAAIFLYSLLHEGLHGVVMKLLGTKKVAYTFGWKFSSARSDDYYSKTGQLLVLLAPVVICALLFVLLQNAVSDMWFWVFVFLHIRNFAGAVGDLYATIILAQTPSNSMVQDNGLCLKIYQPKVN